MAAGNEFTPKEIAEMQLQLKAAQGSLKIANDMMTAVATTLGRIGPTPESPVITVVNNTTTGTGNNQHTYVGAWSPSTTVPGGYQNDMTYVDGSTGSPYVEFKFYGFRAIVKGEKHLTHGISNVTVDGVSAGTIDQYAATSVGNPSYNQTLFDTGVLTEGVHTIRITASGTKNVSSTGYYLVHDRVEVYTTQADLIPPVDEGGYDYIVTNDAQMTAACAAVVAGQTIAMRGGTYRGTYTIANSGTSSNSIRIIAYPNETVVISGLDVVDTSWTVHDAGLGIYKTTKTLPVNGYAAAGITSNTSILANQVFHNGDMQIEARWPKGIKSKDDLWNMSSSSSTSNGVNDTIAWRHYSQFSGGATAWPNIPFKPTYITDPALGTVNFTDGSLVGATVITQGWYFRNSATITGHSSNTISWSGGIWGDSANDQQFRRYYHLTGKLMFLTQAREFHYDGGVLYFKPFGGGAPSGTVEFKARNWGFNLQNRSYITITGINFIGCEPANGNTSTSNCIIDNIKASYMNHNVTHRVYKWQGVGMAQYMGTKLIGTGNIIRNSEFQWSASAATWIGAGGTVQNNLFHHIGYDGMWGAPVMFWGDDNVSNIKVLNNTMYTLSRGAVDNGFAFQEDLINHTVKNTTNNEVAYNNMYDFARLNHDGGAFYSAGYQNLAGTRIHHNWIHDMVSFRPPNGALTDGIMAAVYFDMGSGANVGETALSVDHNVIYRIGDAGGFTSTEVSDIYEKLQHSSYAAKQPTRYYNNTLYGNIKAYTSYISNPASIFRNNIIRKDLNFNWGSGSRNVQYCLMQTDQNYADGTSVEGVSPLFVGGSLASPHLYFQLQSGSPAIGLGTTLTGYNDGDTAPKEAGAYYYGQAGWTAGYVSVPYNP